MGRLTADPELKRTQNDNAVCNFTLAIDRPYTSGGDKKTDFINCIAWRKTGEFIDSFFQKGSMIAVEGSIQVRKWKDNDGNNRYATEALIDRAYFCGGKSEESNSSQQASKPAEDIFEDVEDSELESELPF